MQLDVVIPTYNRSSLLPKALGSLLNARIPPGLDVRIIAVDNNSTDDTKAVIAQLSDPSARAIGLEGARGRLLVRPQGEAVLVVAGLPKREGKTYAVWVIDDGKQPVPAGLFEAASDATVVPVERPVADGSVVAISVEDGPVDAPTSAPVVTSQTA